MSYRNPRDIYRDRESRLTAGQKQIIDRLILQEKHQNSHQIYCKALDVIKYSVSGDDRMDNHAIQEYIQSHIGWYVRLMDRLMDMSRQEIFDCEGMD